MDKQSLLQNVISQLEGELAKARSAAMASHEAATAEENRPENQFDTRALEASFLARGQAARVAELEHSIKVLRELPMKAFGKSEPIQAGALVTLDCDGTELMHFVLPAGAGLQASAGSKRIPVVTANSPLGAELLGKIVGDSFIFRRGPSTKEYEITCVA
ncbi:MAG TPA: transcription elongation factor GreAB [Bdellovibrionota bacterium]|jgi:transcription elongation GreA/GreB family factor